MRFEFDTDSEKEKIKKHWQFCIGSCHAAMALREDYRRDLKICKRELGIEYLRFHGLFDDDMSALTKSLTGEYVPSFTNIDKVFDFVLSIGMRPFVEIGFMPTCLASGETTIFHYKANVTPPKDEKLWVWFIDIFIKHLIDRYGRDEVRSWYFEIWNEPNLGKESGVKGARFFSGGKEDYFRLYALTAHAIKNVDSRLRVGGPATSNNAWICDMVEFCKQSGAPIDFVSTHHYPTDVVLGYGVEDSLNFVNAFNDTDPNDEEGIHKIVSEFLVFRSGIWSRVERGVLTDMAKRARSEAGELPLFYTEWSSLAGIESDGSFGASFIAKTTMDNAGIVDGSSYWAFSDIFEENGMPDCAFHGGFGLMTYDGIKKATFNAFVLLNKLGDVRYKRVFRQDNVDIYTFFDEAADAYQILAVNHNSLLHTISDETVRITVKSDALLTSADVWRIDDEHANAAEWWKKMGAPRCLDRAQVYELKAKSELKRERLDIRDNALTLELPKQGVALVVLYRA